KLISLLSDSATYKQFLSCRNAAAQNLLDLLQDVTRPFLLRALLRLSRVSGQHPRCFALPDLRKVGEQVAAGNFSDLWKGTVSGRDVSVKVMRLFQTSDIEALLKEFSREALIWRQLCHPNLLPFCGLYYLDRRLCLVSPWMENGNILNYLRNKPASISRLSLVSPH
ncbi:hypothetical protein B0H19DRAFT_934461, partial [Mycena capillaripes]